MVGYWIVAGLVALAVAAVVVAGVAPEAAPPGPLRLVVFAASDAAPGPGGPTWPDLVAEGLPPATIDVRNASVGGLTIDEADDELPAVLGEPYDVAIVWLAINDLASGRPLPDYLADLDGILSALSGPGRAVAVANLPDLASIPLLAALVDPAALRAACAEWNEGIARVAARHGADVIDLSGQPVNPEDLSGDGFHPSQVGQQRLAEAFAPWVAARAADR